MDILAIPDIHGDINRLMRMSAELESADIVLLVGDITNFGGKQEIAEIIKIVQQHNFNILAVPGNCDFPPVSAYLNQLGINIETTHQVVDGIGFVGLGASLYSPSRSTPNEVSEQELADNLAKAVSDLPQNTPFVLVSHQPPRDTRADRISESVHVGSHSVRRFLEKYQPLVCFSGHIHEGSGIDVIGETQVVNPGPFFRGNYAVATINGDLESLEIRNQP